MTDLLGIKIVMSQTNGKPSIELRRNISDPELMKDILYCAFHEQPLVIMPMFSDKLSSINVLLDKGIIKKNNKNEYVFT